MLREIPAPEQALAGWREKIKTQWAWAFWGTVLPGLLVHFYRMSHYFMVDDSPYFSYHQQNISYLGRWMLQWAGAISSSFEPAARSVWLGEAAPAVFAALFVQLPQLNPPLLRGVIGCCLAVLPAVTTTMLFAYAADPYMLALVLAAGAVLAARRLPGWKGVAGGAVLLCLSMAIYQAYLDVAVLLCLLVCFGATLQGGCRRALATAGQLALAGAAGVLLYMGSTKLVLGIQGVTAIEYGGFSSMGQLDPAGSLRVLRTLYLGADHVFMNKLVYATSLPWQLLGWGILGLMALLAAALLWQSGRRQGLSGPGPLAAHWALGCLWLVLLPAGATTLAILQPETFPYNSLNGFANGLFLLIPLVFADWMRPSPLGVVQLTRWATLGALLLMSWHFTLLANQSARVLEIIAQRDVANSNRILARMEMQEGYSIHARVFFGGKGVEVVSETPLMEYADLLTLMIRGVHTDSLLFGDNAYHHFLNDNFGTNFAYLSEAEQQAILDSAEYAAMPPWPAEGCVRTIGDVLVVRLSE